ncbi:hypothetical protein D500_00820 [Mycoplasma feriruminatoris]|nr:hypothetical protein D500_00820 [Mycoplasma feriruminatoris]
MSSVIDRESNKNIAFNSFCICLRFIKSELFNDKYIGYFFRSRSFRAQAEKMAQGISRFNINQNILKKAVIYYPNNIKEQSNIGKLLHNLDSLITLHQWECNFWNLKKFEIKIHRFFTRFCKKSKKYTHTWEQEKLEKLVFYKTSSIILNNLNNNGKYCVYDANGIAGKIDIEPVSEEYISIIKDGAGAGRVRLLPKNTHILSTMGAILPLNTTDIKFVYFLLSKNSHLMKEASGSTIPHIYFKNYSQNIYIVPCNKEQYKISSLFSNLDSLITLHQWECNFWNLKKFEIKIHRFFTRFCKKSKKNTHTWEQEKLGNLIRSVNINMCEVAFPTGKFEVIQQGSEPILGYVSNVKQLPYFDYDSVILFGDHTLSLYKPKKPFFVASDGVKAYIPTYLNSYYLYYLIQKNMPSSNGYKRHSSILKAKDILLSSNILEQKKLIFLFSNLDSLITLHQRGYKWRENIWKKMIYCYTNTFKIE